MRCTLRCFVLLFLLSGFGLVLHAQCTQDCPERRNISVAGTGVVTADADLAIVRVGYKLYGPDAKAAYATAVDTSNAIMQALTASGIAKNAIESTSQILQHTPIYELQQMQAGSVDRSQREFTVTQSWVARVRPDDAGKALNTAISAGANESGWIEWIVQDPDAMQARASADALAHARLIAQQLADRSNVQLGHLFSVTQNESSAMGALNGIGGGVGMGNGFRDAVQFGNQQLAVNSRRVEFKVSVFAVFSIE